MIRRRNIIEVHFDPHKYESADCTILGDFAYISYLCLLIYLWYDQETGIQTHSSLIINQSNNIAMYDQEKGIQTHSSLIINQLNNIAYV